MSSFFENAIYNGLLQLPNQAFRDRQQASIDAKWDVTTDRYIVEEENDIGDYNYHEIEAWITNAMGMTTRGAANPDDFKVLTFKNINHAPKRGTYYKFNDNIWITHSTDEHSSLDASIGVRRCNNVLKLIDPENGSIYCIPCVLDYEATSPNTQVSSWLLTPNNHIKIYVQGNKDTFRLFKLNTRFILEGRAFKLSAYQDAIVNEDIAPLPTYLTLNLFLDEIHAKDDIENQIADNGDYKYTVLIDSKDMSLPKNSEGNLLASVSLNGREVNRDIVWESSSNNVVSIDDKGNYKVLGDEDSTCIIKASLKGNKDIFDTITVKVSPVADNVPKIIVEPSFDKIRQYESILFKVTCSYNGKIYNPDKVNIFTDDEYAEVKMLNNEYSISGKRISAEEQMLHIDIENNSPSLKASLILPYKVTSMIG